VYEKCAELFGMEKQELERQIEENFCALFWEIC
jgi:Tat protein secretion system quality control protein TatD with DNase activity